MERSLDGLARRMLVVNFASIHTTSIVSCIVTARFARYFLSIARKTFTEVLYRLLASPEYIEPLRQEVEAAVAEEGWTKAGLDKMYKIDSFLRETQRLDGLGISSVRSLRFPSQLLIPVVLVVLVRLALRPFTFSNGMTVPAGTILGAPLNAIHTDGEIYTRPDEFDGFRFAKLREQEGGGSKHQMGTTSTTHVPFGHGRHAW